MLGAQYVSRMLLYLGHMILHLTLCLTCSIVLSVSAQMETN